MTTYAHDYEPTLLQAAQKAWAIAALHRAQSMDRSAALFSLSCLHQHKNPRIRALCVRVAETIDRPAAVIGEPVTEAFHPQPTGAA